MELIQLHPNTLRQMILVKPPPPLDVKKGRDEWKLFKQLWSNYCIDTRLDNEEEVCKRGLFLHTLGKEGLALYKRMQIPVDDFVDNIVTAFDNHFFGRTSETYQRYVFNKRDQKSDENIEDYIAALRYLVSTCNFCDCLKDSLLRDRIILGIKDSSTRKQLLQEADLNLETCIAMCRAAEDTSPSQPVETVTWTEDTTAVQAGSVSSGDQRPGKKQDFIQSLSHCVQMASPDEVEMPEVNLNTELGDSDDSALQWTTEQQSSGTPRKITEQNIPDVVPAWSMEEDSPDQPSTVYSTVQPMSDNTSGLLLSLKRDRICQHCSAGFVLVSSLELHLASVHGEKLHVVLPGSSTPGRCDAGNRSNTDIDKEVDTCGKRKRRVRKKIDEDGVIKSRQHVCDVCRKSFPALGKLNRHKLIHSDVRPFVCDVCSKSFTLACNLKAHKLTHSGNKPFACDMCSKSFIMASYLSKHKMTHVLRKPFVCDVCDKSFAKPSVLKTHKLKHSGHKPFSCDMCGKRFAQSSSLTSHRRVHTGERPYKCPHCDSAFKQLINVQTHIISAHDGARTHLCDICGAAFSRKSHLTRHKRTHTGEKPFVCPDCGKVYTASDSLKRHLRTHTGEKPHVCSDCGKAYACSNGLRKHRLTHSKEKLHVCSLCGKKFTWAKSLTIHRATHFGDKPHSCPHCPYSCRSSCDLKNHIERKHQ